jgi:hypothetical protein
MQRPKDMPPSLFVDRGLAAAAALRNTPPDASIDQMILDHVQFRQGGALDAQRVNGVVVDQYVDYAMVGIGLYHAAAGDPARADPGDRKHLCIHSLAVSMARKWMTHIHSCPREM